MIHYNSFCAEGIFQKFPASQGMNEIIFHSTLQYRTPESLLQFGKQKDREAAPGLDRVV